MANLDTNESGTSEEVKQKRKRGGTTKPAETAPQDAQAPESAPQDVQAPETAPQDVQAPETAPQDVQAPETAPQDVQEGDKGPEVLPDIKNAVVSNPLAFKIVNNGAAYYEMALKKMIKPGENHIIFADTRQRRIVLTNLAQANALSGKKDRFVVNKE